MSKSYGNAIDLADTPDQIRAKCKSMFTDPTRVRRTDAGHPETCNLFAFHELVSPPELKERVARECRQLGTAVGTARRERSAAIETESRFRPVLVLAAGAVHLGKFPVLSVPSRV